MSYDFNYGINDSVQLRKTFSSSIVFTTLFNINILQIKMKIVKSFLQ